MEKQKGFTITAEQQEMNIPELLREGAASTRTLAALQGDSNHIKDAERMEAAADELERLVICSQPPS